MLSTINTTSIGNKFCNDVTNMVASIGQVCNNANVVQFAAYYVLR